MSLLKFTRTTTKMVAFKKLQYFYMKLFTLFIRFVCILLHLQMSYNSDILGINGTYFDKKKYVQVVDQQCMHYTIFLRCIPARTSDEKAVCLSVRLSVKRVHCDKTEGGSVQIFISYQRSFSLLF